MKHVWILIAAFTVLGCAAKEESVITASGVIEATEVTVSAKVGGEVKALFAGEGDPVAKADTLALIDRSDLAIQLRQAEANLAAMEAQYKLTRQGFRKEDVLQAEATFASAREDLRRAEDLLKTGTVSQKQFDDTRTRFLVTRHSYEKFKSGSRTEEIDAARARRDLAIAQVQAMQKKLADTYVIAPTQGVITAKGIEEGDIVVPNGSMFRISRLDKVHLMIYVSEVELAHVKLGQEARVYIDALPDTPFAGKVTYISDRAEFTPKNVQTKDDRTKLVFGVKIEVPNSDQRLKPGMPADAHIAIASLPGEG
jgi:HlyD family secretion protein